jgi:phenylacetate-CoA ligase
MPFSRLAVAATNYAAAHWRWRTLDRAALQALQETRARASVAYAADHSPFYRNHWQGHNLAQWRTLPTVDKAAMMDHFADFNTRGITAEAAMQVALTAEQTRDFAPRLQAVTVGLSSGTSGHRGLFLVSAHEQAMWAGVILARALHSLDRGRTRVAFFLRSYSNLYAAANGVLLHLRYFDLMTPLPEAIAELNSYQPHIVVGPPSLLGFLAGAQKDGRLHIRPRRLISVAEVLEPQDEADLAAAFQAPVQQIYQSTEGLLAVTCHRGALHIQEDLVAIQCEPLARQDAATLEVVAPHDERPDRQEHATSGAPESSSHALDTGALRVTPIVTDLWRRAQPIIRYRLNDVLQLGAPCACGSCFRTITRIEGRCDDVCYFLAGDNSRQPFFPDTIRRMVLLASPTIADYGVVQAHDGDLHVHLQLPSGAEPQAVFAAVRASVEATVAHYGCRPPQLTIDAELPPLPPGRKRRRVQRRAC